MTSFSLKLLAAAAMVIDHLGRMMVHFSRGDSTLYALGIAFRCVGRLAMPMFAFLIAEGYRHTSDRKRYIFRIGLFAVLSEMPFDLMYTYGRAWADWEHQNILLTFFLSLLALELYTLWMGRGRKWPALGAVIVCAALAQLFGADYGCFAVLLVFLFYVLEYRRRETVQLVGLTLTALALWFSFTASGGTGWTQFFALVALFPLLRYTGKPGKRNLKWFFYVFYPVHLLLLGLLCRALFT